MSSTRFNPPVPSFEEIGPLGVGIPDGDGLIYPGENDIAGTTNKRTLRSYISNLTRGIAPTSDVLPAVIEYNGPVPDHGNAYPVGDGAGLADRTFTQRGIEGGSINELQDYSDSGRFSVNDRTLADIVNKGELGRAHGEDALSGHLLLQGIIGSPDTESPAAARTDGARVVIDAVPEILSNSNRYSPDEPAITSTGTTDLSSRLKITRDSEILSSGPAAPFETVSVEALSQVAIDIMLRATGKTAGPDSYGGVLAGLTPSGVQYGTSRVDSDSLRARNYAGVAGLSPTLDGTGPVDLPTSDEVGEDRYTNKSYGVTYNPLEGFSDLTSGVTSFALLATTATAAVLAVLGIFSFKGVGQNGEKFPTYSQLKAKDSDHLQKGKFRFEEKAAEGVVEAFLQSAGVDTDIAKILNFYSPSNGKADYGSCVVIGFASLLGAKFEDDTIIGKGLSGELNLNSLGVKTLLGSIGLRFLAIALTSEKGTYLNLFREIMRDSGDLVTNIGDVGLTNVIPSLTQSKIVRFVDTLAKIGDLIVLQALAKEIYRFNKEDNNASPYETTFNVIGAGRQLIDANLKFGMQRIRGSRFGKKRGASLGAVDIPSAHLIPESYQDIIQDTRLSSYTPSSSSNRTNLKLSREDVVKLEETLDAEYMPFYFQDLRTNEIISFHAFLDELSDSYSAEYNSTSGYGRIEDIKMYKNTKRSVGCTFHLIAMNPDDFNYMWWQINKLTTMVYPQWSQGRSINTKVDDVDIKFTQPFSQVPTATPLMRIRVGDLIRSNYSRFNLKRLFGAKDADKNLVSDSAKEYYLPAGRYEARNAKRDISIQETIIGPDLPPKYKKPGSQVADADENKYEVAVVGALDSAVLVTVDKIQLRVSSAARNEAIEKFFEPDQNAIIKSFESTMGMGLAAVVTQLQFTWMDGGYWGAGEDGPGARAPRSCKIQMSFEPIHDIAPGLDHQGLNRAPIYPVGPLVNRLVEGGQGNPYGSGTQSRGSLGDLLKTVSDTAE